MKVLNLFPSSIIQDKILINEFLTKNSSSTLQSTSTIAFPIPKTFILSFFGNNSFFSIWVASSANFAF